jgi:hypothetical protein
MTASSRNLGSMMIPIFSGLSGTSFTASFANQVVNPRNRVVLIILKSVLALAICLGIACPASPGETATASSASYEINGSQISTPIILNKI